jgi:3-methyladenine DNA glycosylase AlkD
MRREAVKTVSQVMTALKKAGSAQTRKTFERHGAPENLFGVKVADLKVIAKQIKGNQELACELYDTGNSDAMYLAGIVADGSRMTTKQLDAWAKAAPWYYISEYAVPGVANENPHARELALKWIKSKQANVAACGWSTYSGVVATKPDDELDLKEIEALLKQVEKNIDKAPNRVKYTMNGFVISVGGYVKPLSQQAKATAKKLGKVDVDVGDTACKVPLATEYIEKMETAGRAFKKRKTTKC